MKQYIEKIALAEKILEDVPIEAIFKKAGVPKILPSDRLKQKWQGQLSLTEEVLEVLPYWDWAIENNYKLPPCLRIDSTDIRGLRLPANRKKVTATDAYTALREIISKDDLRTALCGVFHNKGFMVATNSYMLVKTKQPYFLEVEGLIKRPDALFETIDEQYPDFENAIPLIVPGNEILNQTVSLSEVYGYVSSATSATKNIWFAGPAMASIAPDSNFNLHNLQRILRTLLMIGVTHARLFQSTRNRGLVIESIDGNHIGMIMPVMTGETSATHFQIPLLPVEIEAAVPA